MFARKDIRLPGYDYSTDGCYFVTIVSQLRLPLLGQYERIVCRMLLETVRNIPGSAIDVAVVMTNHMHCIVTLEKCDLVLGEIIRRFKAKVSHELHRPMWQANYYEHIIRTEEAYARIRDYIMFNPEKELIKCQQFYPKLRVQP